MYHEMPQKTFKYQMMNCMANNTHNTLHKTPTNDKNVGCPRSYPLTIKPVNIVWALHLFWHLNRSSKGNIWMSSQMGVAVTFINKSSGCRRALMAPPPPWKQGRSQQHSLISRGSHRGKNIETMQPRHLLGKKMIIQYRSNYRHWWWKMH